MQDAFVSDDGRIRVERYRYGSRAQHVAWSMYLDGESIGTSSTKRRALDFARATMALRDHEAVHGKPTEDEIFGRL